MMQTYDVIVVGARCAGSPTAMLLARQGHRVLVVDRATFPSDTLSTHLIHPVGVAALERWGLLDEVVATGCPPIERYNFDFGHFTIAGRPQPDGSAAYGPRRTVLDKILVDAAADAGAEVREGFALDEVVVEDGVVTGIRGRTRDGRTVTESARLVVGADGRNSKVAQAVRPEQYNERAPLEAGYYAYWSGLPTDGFEAYIRPERGWAAIPTNDDVTLVVAGWPMAEFEQNRRDIEGSYMKAFELAPSFAARIRRAERRSRLQGGFVSSYFRTPTGPGWALVGDAGYNKDPMTAFGISDAFRDAELCARALHESLSGVRTIEDAGAEYRTARDERSMPMFELTCNLASFEPPPPDMQQLLGAVSRDQSSMDEFVSVMAGTMSPPDLFGPHGAARVMTRAGALTPA